MAAVALAVAVSLVWCAVSMRIGPTLGYLDQPDGSPLKSHTRPAVPLGGVGLFLAIHAYSLVVGEIDPALLAATTIVVVLGLVDDRLGLSPGVRLLIEALAVGILLAGASRGWSGLIIGFLLVMIAINAVNLYDGLDGLAGLAGLISAGGLVVLAMGRGLSAVPAVGLAAGLVGFLMFNWHPARVFLGDSGSYLIGMVLAAQILHVSLDDSADLVVVAGILGVFVIDLAVTLIRRRLHGSPLFEGDRSHVYDQLRGRGWTVRRVAVVGGVAQTLCVGVVVLFASLLMTGAALTAEIVVFGGAVLGLASAGFLRVDSAD